MECNKDEATRARDIAKRKFLENDVSGARRFALKAQCLYPELYGISQMVATFDVHLSAQNIIHGEIDYYGVLGLNPESDDETMRKRYRKLAVTLHPDRNKSVGAEEAFKLLSQAWGVFSDKAKRADYDLKRKMGLYEGGGASSSKLANNGFQKVTKTSGNTTQVKSSERVIKRASDASAAAAATTSTPAHKTTADGTFWTVCRSCKTQYEYHRVYLNQNLLCPNCRKPFIAVETDPPGSGSISKTFHEYYTGAGSRKDKVVRREYNRRAAGVSSINASKRRKGMENAVSGSNNASCTAAKSTSGKEFSEDELRNLLMKKVKQVIIKKLQELGTIIAETKTDKQKRNGN